MADADIEDAINVTEPRTVQVQLASVQIVPTGRAFAVPPDLSLNEAVWIAAWASAQVDHAVNPPQPVQGMAGSIALPDGRIVRVNRN